jgi:hypothetical protein
MEEVDDGGGSHDAADEGGISIGSDREGGAAETAASGPESPGRKERTR